MTMLDRNPIGILALKTASLLAALMMSLGVAAAAEEGKYPNWKGQWNRQRVTGLAGQPSFDPNKSWGKGQQAPLTPEYQAVLEANLKSQREGGFFDWLGSSCRGFGMPLIMYPFQPMEFIVTPETTYVLIDWVEHTRRIYTDGRDWPKEIDPTLVGYSIGKWLDTNNDGTYDTLEIETRALKGVRLMDNSGIPLSPDGQTIVKEKMYLDKASPDVMHNEITTIDPAFTRPWTVSRFYKRVHDGRPQEYNCAEDNRWVVIGGRTYVADNDGYLMPIQKDEPPPDPQLFQKYCGPKK